MWKLLEELAKIDAKTYEKISFACMDAFEGHTPESMLDDSPNDEVEIVCDLIQGACQRVIAARGWSLKQSQDCSGKLFIATIGEIQGDDISCEWKEESDSPAKAILTAYLKSRKDA